MAQGRHYFTGIRGKWLIYILALTIIPAVSITIISFMKSSSSLNDGALRQMESVLDMSRKQVLDWYKSNLSHLRSLSDLTPMTGTWSRNLNALKAKYKMDPNGTFNTGVPEWKTQASAMDNYFMREIILSGFYDVLFVGADDGMISYTFKKEADLGENLAEGKLKATLLAKVWRETVATRKIVTSDIECFEPSANGLFFFMGAPLFSEDSSLSGVLIAQISAESMTPVLDIQSAMNGTGEIELIGEDGVYRSNKHGYTDVILKMKSSVPRVSEAFAGKLVVSSEINTHGAECVNVIRSLGLRDSFGTSFDWVIVGRLGNLAWCSGCHELRNSAMVDAAKPVTELRNWIFFFLAIAIVLATFCSIWLTSRISKPIVTLSENMRKLSGGDLRIHVERSSDDELGDLCDSTQAMVESLRAIVRNVTDSAEKVSISSAELSTSAEEMNATMQEVSSTVQQIAIGADATAHSVESTVLAMKSVGTAVTQVSARSREADDVAVKTNEAASHGGQQVDEAITKMNRIYSKVNSASDVVKRLGQRSDQINEIVDVITHIADQTNLLALNAAIEAARAGDVGRGFAVVADEVRKLSEGSNRAATEIGALIAEIQKETSEAVRSMEEGSREVEEGRDVVNRAGQALQEIVRLADHSVGMVRQITLAAEQMGGSIREVAQSVENIAGTAEESASATEMASASTEEMTASMEEIAATAQSLSLMANNLREAVEQFNTGDGPA